MHTGFGKFLEHIVGLKGGTFTSKFGIEICIIYYGNGITSQRLLDQSQAGV